MRPASGYGMVLSQAHHSTNLTNPDKLNFRLDHGQLDRPHMLMYGLFYRILAATSSAPGDTGRDG